MKNKIIALLLTVISLPAFAQTKVAQKQIDNLQDSLNVRQRYADTNTTDATRNWVLGQIAADTPTLQEVLTKNNVTDKPYVNTNNLSGGSGLRVVKDAIVYKSPAGGAYIGQYIIKHDWLEYIFLAFEISINARNSTEARISKLSFQVAYTNGSNIEAQEGYILSNDKALNDIIESNVKCAFDQDGKLAIILGTPTTNWGSNTVIQMDVKAYNGTDVGWRSGWTIDRTNEDLTSTYTQITSVPLNRMGTRNWVQSQNYEVTTNKVTDFNSANNTKYPTTQAVKSIPLDSILTWNSKNLSPSNFIRINNNTDDRFIRLYSNGLGLYTNTLGTGSVMYYSQLIRGTDSFVFSRNGYFANNNQMIYGFIGGTGYNQQHIMRYDTSKVWFGSTASTTSPAANTATYRYSAMSGNDGSVQIDNLAGTGTRMVVASSTGVLSTNAMPVTSETDPVYTADKPGVMLNRGYIANSTNLNTISIPGMYICESAVAATLTNSPTTDGFILVVYGGVNNYISQEIYKRNTAPRYKYYRIKVSASVWTPWKIVIDGGANVSLLTNDAGYITSYQNIANTNLTIDTSRTLSIAAGGELKFDGTGALTLYGGAGNPAGLKFESGSSGAGVLFGAKSFSYTADLRVTNLTGNRILTWPDASGTLALTSDIHGGIVDDGSGYGVSEDSYDGWNTQGGLSTRVVIADDDYTVLPTDYTIICRGGNTWDLELPDPGEWRGRILRLSMQMKDSTGIGVNLSEGIRYFNRADGVGLMSPSYIEGYGKLYELQSNGTYWYLLNPPE